MALSQGFSDELICSICLDTFNYPVTLPCAHTFCKQCLVNVQERCRFRHSIRSSSINDTTAASAVSAVPERTTAVPSPSDSVSRNKLTCPHCRVEIPLGPGGINALPRNTTLANIIMSIEEEKKARNVVCEVCDDEPPRTASKICSDCYVTYCSTCFRQLHPMRGSFKYHVIKEANHTIPAVISRCKSPIIDRANASGRFTPLPDGTDVESGEEGGSSMNQDNIERLRKHIKSKRKELNSALKNVQTMLKSTEDDTEDRMKDVRSMCSQIAESVSEREAVLLSAISQQRHEIVRQCIALTGEVKSCTGRLDLLEDQLNDVTSVNTCYSGTDIGNDIASLKKKLSEIHTKSLISKSKSIERQPRIAECNVCQHVQALDFVKNNVLASPELTSIEFTPVSRGPALVTFSWSPINEASKYTLTASQKDTKNNEIRTSVDVGPSCTCYQMALASADSDYVVSVGALSPEGCHPVTSRTIRTLPYVTSIKIRFNATTCHKKVAVSITKDELVHRKCKLSSLHNACASTTSPQRLETLEGATADECLPMMPHVYWQHIIHFQVFGKLPNSRLLCDIGICKNGSEDGFTPLCDNVNSYAAYLVRRNNRICLEFWNGTKRENLSRSNSVLDVDTENADKTIKLGFYYNAMRKVFAVVSPANNTVLCRFNVKFASALPVYALYSTDQVFVMIRSADTPKLPQVLCGLMAEGW